MGYWQSVRSRWQDIGQVLFLACLWTETESRSINSQKPTRPISSHLDRTSLIYYVAFRELFLASPARATELHLARSGSQSQRRIVFILPAHGACHIITELMEPKYLQQLSLLWQTFTILWFCNFRAPCWPLWRKARLGQILNNVIFRIQYHYSNKAI